MGKDSQSLKGNRMDVTAWIALITGASVFGLLYWWGVRPNQMLSQALDKILEEGYEPDDSKPLVVPPVYRKSNFKEVSENLPKEDDPVVAARSYVLTDYMSRKDRVNEVGRETPKDTTREDAPIKPVVVLLNKYGRKYLTDPLLMDDLRKPVTELTDAGYELKKVWPSKGESHVAHLIYRGD